MNNYTEEQLKDIKERQEKLIAYCTELEVQPLIRATKELIKDGNVYADKLEIVLMDTKYIPKEDKVIAEKVN